MILNKQRLAVVIGRNGETKKLIEKLTRTQIDIDSKTGDVTIVPIIDESREQDIEGTTPQIEMTAEKEQELPILDSNGEEKFQALTTQGNFNTWITENILRAINRGFNPDKALRLLNDDYMLEIIDLEQIFGRSEKNITRVKGRIIGEAGSMRGAIEQYASCFISVFGNTIAIIGPYEELRVARKAIQMLVQGVPHKNVYSFIEKKYKEKKDENIKQLWKPTFD